MRQYAELKKQAGSALLFFRMGDFYELFGPDAVVAAKILDITLTTRDRNRRNPIPMAGVPHHSVQSYVQKLLNAGHRVAISEQILPEPSTERSEREDVRSGDKIVRREIVRTLTPAIQFDQEGAQSRYLAIALAIPSRRSPSHYILAALDIATGETLVSEPLSSESLQVEAQRLPIHHFLQLEGGLHVQDLNLRQAPLIEELPKHYASTERAASVLKTHYEVGALRAFLSEPVAIQALGILVLYALRSQQKERLEHLRLPEPLRRPHTLQYGPNTVSHLALNELMALIDQTHTPPGARELRRWLSAPLSQSGAILERQIAVAEFLRPPLSQMSLRKICDLERVCARLSTQLAGPRDTRRLGESLVLLPELIATLALSSSTRLQAITQTLRALQEPLSELGQQIMTEQRVDAPASAREGQIFELGVHPDLDYLIEITEHGERWLSELELRERQATQIPSLKVRANRVFGYYLEITHAHLQNVPAHYQRKQTMVGAERYVTEELKKFEQENLTATERRKSFELDLFTQLTTKIQALIPQLMACARLLGEIDALASLSRLHQWPQWNNPAIDDSFDVDILRGRHAVLERRQGGSFVPNDLQLSPHTRLTLLITGPNMGGKSTLMRQNALIVILGQMGAPVPAECARWGAFDAIFTRIGAQDDLARGESTFMVEMSELAHILHHASDRSLVVLDEIGRGTSTYDGMSVAWAALEYLTQAVGCRTLFATHYHELVHLEQSLPRLQNVHVSVEKTGPQSLRFLYELRTGPTSESFGVHVAQMAGLPRAVVRRAWALLEELESAPRPQAGLRTQLDLFATPPSSPQSDPTPELILSDLRGLSLDELTPRQAWNLMEAWQNKLKDSGESASKSPSADAAFDQPGVKA